MSNVDCAACADPRGDATCAACCQEGVASDAASLARQLRAIANMPARLARERLLAWASECDDTDLTDLTDETIDTIAEETASHRRTVERRLLGLPVRGRVASRVDAVLAKRGLLNRRVGRAPRGLLAENAKLLAVADAAREVADTVDEENVCALRRALAALEAP